MSSLAPGTPLGPYVVDAPLGSGGMGEVYKAVDQRLGRTVALKVLPAEFATDPDRRRRLEREARIVSNLSHPHICTLFDIGQEGDVWFLVMEYLEGETLDARLSRGPLPVDEACRLAVDIAGALALAHSRGIVHRDLKPGNIMLTADGVKVLDFGLAKAWLTPVWLGAPASGADSSDSLTLEGAVLGTPPYMSPEQLRADDVTASADIFAFGAVLFEMLTGRRAFSGPTPVAIAAQVLSEARPSLCSDRTLPPALELIVSRCLALSPDDRWPSMQSVVDVLRQMPDAPADGGRPGVARSRRGRTGAAAGLVAGVVLVAGAAGLVFWMQPPSPTTVALLPFANETGSADLDPLIDGIAISVIDRLSEVADLRVTSWSSVDRLRDAGADARAIASSLGVDWVVTARISLAGEALSSQVSLVGPADEDDVQRATYSWTRGDDRAVPRDIAQAIVTMLAVPLDRGAADRLSSLGTEHQQAAAAYLRGLSAFKQRRLREALEQFHAANQDDPAFAPAAAGLASTYALFGTMGWDVQSPANVVPVAKQWAERALDLDPNLAEAHATLAFVLRFERERVRAGEEHQLAVALNRSCTSCLQWLASHLWTQNHFIEARARLDEAERVDRNSAVLRMNIGRHYYYQRDYDLAIPRFQEAVVIDQDFWLAAQLIILSHVQQGDHAAARAVFDSAALRGAPALNRKVIETYLLAAEGRTAEAERQLADLRAQASRESAYLPEYLFAPIYATLGDLDRAMAALEAAEAEGSGYLEYLGLEPTLDPVRRHPDFPGLLERMKLQDFSPRVESYERPAA